MKSYFILFFSVLNISLFAQSPGSFRDLHTTKTSGNINNKACFTENKGQIMTTDRKPNNEVKYLLALNGMNVQLRNIGFSYDTYMDKSYTGKKKNNPAIKYDMDSISRTFDRVDVEFLNAQVPFVFEAKNAKDGYLNFYTGGTPEKGITCVREFQNIICKNIYPNIDIEYYSDIRNGLPVFEYRFIVNPGGKIEDIKMKFSGTNETFIENNKVIIRIDNKIIEETIPVSYILETNNKIKINWKELDKNTYGFSFNNNTPSGTIIIDPLPQLIWCTYYGGVFDEHFSGLCNDNVGNVIICGNTASFDNIASSGAYNSFFMGGNYDGFCAKFSPDGVRQWGTYIGGWDNDAITSVSSFTDNNLIVCGATNSMGLGTAGTHQDTLNKNDGFIVKLTPNGYRVWFTYFGGDSIDGIANCAIDGAGKIFITGQTFSPNNIATAGAYQDSLNDSLSMIDCYIACFDSTGAQDWGTYLGSCKFDYPGNIGIGSNFIAVSGSFGNDPNFNSTGFPFVTIFSKTGQFRWISFLGGEASEYHNKLSVNSFDEIYLVGEAIKDSGIVTAGCYQSVYRGFRDSYLAKFDTSGNKIWATYFGGNDWDGGRAVCTNHENIFITGNTFSNDFIATSDALQTQNQSFDAFIAKFNRQGNLLWGTYLGGNDSDEGNSISIFSDKNLYVAGSTYSDSGLVTNGAFDTVISGYNADGFIAKISFCNTSYLSATADTFNCLNDTLDLIAHGAISYLWNGPQDYSSADSVNHLFPIDTLFTGQYYVVGTDPDGCKDTIVFDITVDNCMFVDKTPGLSFKCYPNPAVNYIRIEGTEAGSDLMLINNLGQTMYYNVVTGNETGIDVGSLPPGYYTLVYINKVCTETVKIVKY